MIYKWCTYSCILPIATEGRCICIGDQRQARRVALMHEDLLFVDSDASGRSPSTVGPFCRMCLRMAGTDPLDRHGQCTTRAGFLSCVYTANACTPGSCTPRDRNDATLMSRWQHDISDLSHDIRSHDVDSKLGIKQELVLRRTPAPTPMPMSSSGLVQHLRRRKYLARAGWQRG